MDGLETKQKRILTPEQIERRQAEDRLIKRLERQADGRVQIDTPDWKRILREDCEGTW